MDEYTFFLNLGIIGGAVLGVATLVKAFWSNFQDDE